MKSKTGAVMAGMLTCILLGSGWLSAADITEIQLQMQDEGIQIVTDANAPAYYLEYRTPESSWQKWNAGQVIDQSQPVWFRAVFESGDVMLYQPPSDVDTFYSPLASGDEDGDGLTETTVGAIGLDGKVLSTRDDDWKKLEPLAEHLVADSIPEPANNQAYATPDPGKAKLFWLQPTTGDVIMWGLTDDGTRKAANVSDAQAPGGWQVVGAGDIDQDGIDDLMWFRPSDGKMAYWLMEPDGYRKAAGDMGATAPGGWQIVGIGDIDQDGTVDLMWFRPTDGKMAYWLLNTDGTRKAAGDMGATAPGGWQVVGTGDIDQDGTVDLMWFRPSDGKMAYWLLNSDGTRKAAGDMGATAPGGWSVVATGDIDQDGTVDLMWYRPSDGNMAYWLLNINGTRKAAGNMGSSAPDSSTVVASGE